MEKLLICIPTYNEGDNIIDLLDNIINASLQISSFKIDILVIDDNSPDGTAQQVKNFTNSGEKLGNISIQIIENPGKGGLGKAYLQAFQYAIDNGYWAVCQMDADHSHNPKYLPEICKLIQHYDLVIGSRYVKGGGVRNWSLLRKFISFGGNLYSRIILGIGVHDLTGGYNCYRVAVFDKLSLNSIKSKGYAFLIELKYRTVKLGFRWIETPIIFVDRTKGLSKLSNSIFFEAILSPWRLRFQNKNKI